MRIAFISLARHGGTLLCAVKLAEALQRLGHEMIYAGSRQADYRPEIARALYANTGQSGGGNALCTLNPFNHFQIARFVKASCPDVVCFPLDHAWNALSGLSLRRTPQVFVIHDPQRHLGEENAFYSALTDWNARRMSRLIVLSRAFQKPMADRSHRPVDVVPHGELGAFDPYVPPPQQNRLLFTGRLRAYKGIDLLLESFALARKVCPQIALTIAGSGTIASVALPAGVTLIQRWLSDGEMRQLYHSHDAVIASYLEATQSGVVAQAQSAGRAVIVTDVGGLPEQIRPEETGLLVAPDAQAVSRAIVRLFQELDYVKMGQAGRTLYQNEFNWDRLAGLAAASFAKVIAEKR